MRTNEPIIEWPKEGVRRVPFKLYTSPEIYAKETRAVFRGPAWHFLALAVELPNNGDFKNTFVGEIPIIVVRDKTGEINAMVNRCTHKGALVCHDKKGNKPVFTCPYHNWSFDQTGKLVGVAFRNGVKGVGGMPDTFKTEDHGLEPLRIAIYNGLIFGTFSSETPDIETYLGPEARQFIDRVFNRPIKILGQYSQGLRNNWKLMMENTRDTYHAGILHLFFNTFGLNRLSMEGGIVMSNEGRHHVSYSKLLTDDVTGSDYEDNKLPNMRKGLKLSDPSVGTYLPEFEDGITLQIQTIFPTFLIQQIQNCLGIRQLIPRGLDKAELIWTLFGYEDDDEEMTQTRIKQSNLVGPAGFVSLEDGAVLDFVQRSLRESPDDSSVVELGDETDYTTTKHRVTETAVRAYWDHYRDLMGL